MTRGRRAADRVPLRNALPIDVTPRSDGAQIVADAEGANVQIGQILAGVESVVAAVNGTAVEVVAERGSASLTASSGAILHPIAKRRVETAQSIQVVLCVGTGVVRETGCVLTRNVGTVQGGVARQACGDHGVDTTHDRGTGVDGIGVSVVTVDASSSSGGARSVEAVRIVGACVSVVARIGIWHEMTPSGVVAKGSQAGVRI